MVGWWTRGIKLLLHNCSLMMRFSAKANLKLQLLCSWKQFTRYYTYTFSPQPWYSTVGCLWSKSAEYWPVDCSDWVCLQSSRKRSTQSGCPWNSCWISQSRWHTPLYSVWSRRPSVSFVRWSQHSEIASAAQNSAELTMRCLIPLLLLHRFWSCFLLLLSRLLLHLSLPADWRPLAVWQYRL